MSGYVFFTNILFALREYTKALSILRTTLPPNNRFKDHTELSSMLYGCLLIHCLLQLLNLVVRTTRRITIMTTAVVKAIMFVA